MSDRPRRPKSFTVVAKRSRGGDPVVYERVGSVTAASSKEARSKLKVLISMGAFPSDAEIQKENET